VVVGASENSVEPGIGGRGKAAARETAAAMLPGQQHNLTSITALEPGATEVLGW
jgi:hypothetical protein